MKYLLIIVLSLLMAPLVVAQTKSQQAAPALKRDTLTLKRSLFSTAIYQDTTRMSGLAMRGLLQTNPKALLRYRMGNWLKPVIPVLALGGFAIAYTGLKGEQKSAMIRGVHTLQQPNVPEVPVTYTQRSLPEFLAGMGLLVGSICLIEVSNELITKSVIMYNAKVGRKTAHVDHLRFGLTTTGQLGFEAHF